MEERREAKIWRLRVAQNPNKVKGLEGAGVTPGPPTPTSQWQCGEMFLKITIIKIIVLVVIKSVGMVVIVHPSHLHFSLEQRHLALPGCFCVLQGFERKWKCSVLNRNNEISGITEFLHVRCVLPTGNNVGLPRTGYFP